MSEGPVGFAALLERMPRAFKKQAKAVEKRARQRREVQAERFEQDFSAAESKRRREVSGGKPAPKANVK